MDNHYHKVVSRIVTYKDKIPDEPKPDSLLIIGHSDNIIRSCFIYAVNSKKNNNTTSNITTLEPDKIERRLCTTCKSFKFEYDSDSEDDNNRQQKNFLAGRKTKILYENDQWVITNKERQESYKRDLDLKLVDNIVKVWYNVVEGCSRKQK